VSEVLEGMEVDTGRQQQQGSAPSPLAVRAFKKFDAPAAAGGGLVVSSLPSTPLHGRTSPPSVKEEEEEEMRVAAQVRAMPAHPDPMQLMSSRVVFNRPSQGCIQGVTVAAVEAMLIPWTTP
jgi:hypothetical protein